MKNRMLTGILFIVALGIWGGVFFKITTSVSVEKPAVKTGVLEQKMVSVTENKIRKNYRDPFLGEWEKPVIPVVVKKEKPVVVIIKEPERMPEFRFQGVIRKNKKQYLVVENFSGQHLLGIKDSIDGFRIEQVFPDSLQVSRKRKIYTIVLK